MTNKIVEYTPRQFLEAVRRNGLRRAIGSYFRDYDGNSVNSYNNTRKIGSACAMGQGFINLGVEPSDSDEDSLAFSKLYDAVVHLNDGTYRYNTSEDILDTIVSGALSDPKLEPYLDTPIKFKTKSYKKVLPASYKPKEPTNA